MTYISAVSELRDFLSDDERVASMSDTILQDLSEAGEEMINGYCGKPFGGNPPKLVKVVNMELVRALMTDASKSGENIDDYSYTNNQGAFDQILGRLSYLRDGNNDLLLDRGKSVKAMVI